MLFRSVDEAIDSGIINSEVKNILGLKGVGNRKLDLNVTEDANFVEARLRTKLNELKQQAQDLLEQYMADPFAENNLYDVEGNLSEKAKEVLWRDMQAQELERLLKKQEVATLLGLSQRSVERLVSLGKLTKIKILGAVRFKEKDVIKLANEGTV